MYLWVLVLLANSAVETIKMSIEAADRFGGHKAECLFGPRMVYAAVGRDEILIRARTRIGVAHIKINIWARNLFARVTRTDWDRDTERQAERDSC